MYSIYRKRAYIYHFSSVSGLTASPSLSAWDRKANMNHERANFASGVIELSDGRKVFIVAGGKSEDVSGRTEVYDRFITS